MEMLIVCRLRMPFESINKLEYRCYGRIFSSLAFPQKFHIYENDAIGRVISPLNGGILTGSGSEFLE